MDSAMPSANLQQRKKKKKKKRKKTPTITMNENVTFSRIPPITVETLRSVIQPILSGLSEDQWILIESDKPDCGINALMAVMVLDVIWAVTDSFSPSMGHYIFMPERLVQIAMGKSLFQSFTEVLGVQHKEPCLFSKVLTNMIGREVAYTLSISPSMGQAHAASRLLPCDTPFTELSAMVAAVLEMFHALAGDRKMAGCPRRSRTRSASVDGVSPTVVQRVVAREANRLTESLLDYVPDSEYELMRWEACQEVKAATEDIDPLTAELMSFQLQNIKRCFVKRLAKAAIHRALAQLRRKHPADIRPQSADAIKTFMANVDPLLRQGANAKFRDDLSEVIYHHLTGKRPEEAPARLSHHVYVDVWNQVTTLQALVVWWVQTQSSLHILRVVRNMEAGQAEDTKKAVVRSLVNHVVLALPKMVKTEESKIILHEYSENHESMVQHLVETIWAELKDREIPLSKHGALKETLVRDLCKKWGSADKLLFSLLLNESKLGKLFVSSLKEQLNKSPNTFSRFVPKIFRHS